MTLRRQRQTEKDRIHGKSVDYSSLCGRAPPVAQHLDSKANDAMIAPMRTTVTLDPDVESTLRRLMRERGVSFKAALNEAVRLGTGHSRRTAARKPFVQKTYDLGLNPASNWDKALAISDSIEDEELVSRMKLRK